jgi:hypothetical protein
MPSILAAITCGIIPSETSKPEPILDLNTTEENELSYLSLATVMGGEEGSEDKVSVLMMDSRVEIAGGGGKMESMLVTGIDGCGEVRREIEGVVRRHGAKIMSGKR